VARGGLLSPANRPKDLRSEREDVSSEPEQGTLGSMNVRDARTNPPELSGRAVRWRGHSDNLRYGPTALIISIDSLRCKSSERRSYREAG
jgi:hypothetical protein